MYFIKHLINKNEASLLLLKKKKKKSVIEFYWSNNGKIQGIKGKNK